MTPDQRASAITELLRGVLPDWHVDHLHKQIVTAISDAESVLCELMPCGHPAACLETYEDEDGDSIERCAACHKQAAAVQAEQCRVLKLAEQSAYVVNEGTVRFVGVREIGILSVYGGSVYFENPPHAPATVVLDSVLIPDPFVTVTTCNVGRPPQADTSP